MKQQRRHRHFKSGQAGPVPIFYTQRAWIQKHATARTLRTSAYVRLIITHKASKKVVQPKPDQPDQRRRLWARYEWSNISQQTPKCTSSCVIEYIVQYSDCLRIITSWDNRVHVIKLIVIDILHPCLVSALPPSSSSLSNYMYNPCSTVLALLIRGLENKYFCQSRELWRIGLWEFEFCELLEPQITHIIISRQ